MTSFMHSVATEQQKFYTQFLLPSNLTPHNWYKDFLVNGSPDLVAIIILSDILAWWRNSAKIISSKDSKSPEFNGESLSISYEYLYDRFGFNKETARRAFVRLEKAQVLTRQVKNVKLEDGSNVNRLYIVLDPQFYQSCFRSPENDIRVEDKKHAKKAVKKGGKEVKSPVDSKQNSNSFQSPTKCGDHICNKTEGLKNRSNESNFVESDLEEKKAEEPLLSNSSHTDTLENTSNLANNQPPSPGLVEKIKAKFTGNKRKPIAELDPITKDEAYSLRLSSGREFSIHYMNKLKEKFGKKYPQHGFFTRAKFLEYMEKALANELREAAIVNNETFYFKENDFEARMRKYLDEIENIRTDSRGAVVSNTTSLIVQLKRSIAVSFDTETAYKILTCCNLPGNIENNIYKLKISKVLNLTEDEHKKLLNIIRSLYEAPLKNIFVQDIDYVQTYKFMKDKQKSGLSLNLGAEGSVWRKISTKLCEYYGEALHKSWFSKLEAEENIDSQAIRLQAPTNFIKDWIKSNYKHVIDRFCQEEGYSLNDVFV